VYGATTLPYINSFLTSGNTYYNYFSTGDPSEPNYLALGAADDFGQTTMKPFLTPRSSVGYVAIW
jgi:hypothetical protein